MSMTLKNSKSLSQYKHIEAVTEIFPFNANVNPYEFNHLRYKLIAGNNLRITSDEYCIDEKDKLPKLTAITLPEREDWLKDHWITLEFKRPKGEKKKLTEITKQLDFLSTEYNINQIPSFNGHEIDAIYVHNNNTKALAYLSSLYKETPIASDLLKAALHKIISWSINKPYLMWQQEIAIALADYQEYASKEDFHLVKINDYCSSNITEYQLSQKNLEQELIYENFLKGLDPEKTEEIFKNAKSLSITHQMDELLEDSNVILVQETFYNETHKEIFHILKDSDKCCNYIDSKYPESMNITNIMAEDIKYNLIQFEKSSHTKIKVIKSLTVVFGLGIELSGALLTIPSTGFLAYKAITFLAKGYAASSSLSMIYEDWLKPSDKKNRETINYNKLIAGFLCKASICDVEFYTSLSENGKKTLTEFYSQYIYNSMINDSHIYINIEQMIDKLIERMPNKTHLYSIGLGKFIQSSLELNNGIKITLMDFIENIKYDSQDCKDQILRDITGNQHQQFDEISRKMQTEYPLIGNIESNQSETNSTEVGILPTSSVPFLKSPIPVETYLDLYNEFSPISESPLLMEELGKVENLTNA